MAREQGTHQGQGSGSRMPCLGDVGGGLGCVPRTPQGGVLILEVPEASAYGLTQGPRPHLVPPPPDRQPPAQPWTPLPPSPLPAPEALAPRPRPWGGHQGAPMRSEQWPWAPGLGAALGTEVQPRRGPPGRQQERGLRAPPPAFSVPPRTASPPVCRGKRAATQRVSRRRPSAPHVCPHTDSHAGGHMPAASGSRELRVGPARAGRPPPGPRVRAGVQA